MTQAEITENIELLEEIINSPDTPDDEKEMAKENITALKQMQGEPKKEPKPRAEKKAKAKKQPRAKEEKPRKKVLEATKDKITYKGKDYTLADCQDLFNAFKTKIKKEKKSSKESSARSTAEKIIDKAQTTIKQILSDKGAKKKIKENPTVAKRELKSVETKFRAFIEAIEKFLGKKMSKTQVDSIFSVIHKKELAEGGGVGEYGSYKVTFQDDTEDMLSWSEYTYANSEQQAISRCAQSLNRKYPKYDFSKMKVVEVVEGEKYANGGGIGGSRDMKFQSKESWERKYKRKTSPKRPRYKTS
jgi:hypothetical protein